MTECGRYPPRRLEFENATPCPLAEGHPGPHRTLTSRAALVWEEASCNCSDCQSEDPDDRCVDWREATEAEKVGTVYEPGLWKCRKCGFQLVQRSLNASTGEVGGRDEPGEKCPNDGAPLWRVTIAELEDQQ